MSNITTWFFILFASTSALLMIVSVPLIRGQVRPNLLYGVRTAKTLADEDAWYRGNSYGGRLLFRTGLAWLIAAAGFYLVPALRADLVAYNLVCGAVIIGTLVLSTVLIFRRLRTL